MRTLLIIIFISIFSIQIVSAQQCETSITKTAIDKLADNWFGLKCDPLDYRTWPDDIKSNCECMKKGEKFTRIKEAFFQKNRDKRAGAIKELLEKKVADVIRSQIDSGFDQSLRLDTLLKQGVVNINSNNNFPKNCRASKVGEVIQEAIDDSVMQMKSTCNKGTLKKRLKMFLNGKKDFKEYLTSKIDSYKNASMNTISEKDKKNGMCIPYKSFQSLNNINPHRKTYLTIAKNFGDFSRFRKWATDRSKPDDVLMLIGNFRNPKKSGRNYLEAAKVAYDSNNGIEGIDREEVLHLIKTDPIFERMVKDESFYKQVSAGDFGSPEEFDENKQELITSMMQSQDRQCIQLYGGSISKTTAEKSANAVGLRGQGNTPQQPVNKFDIQEPNLLTQYLCNEDFPKKFLNDDTIRNVLAPEFKEEGEIKGIKHTEAIIAKWAYCGEDKVEVAANGSTILTIIDVEAPKKEKEDLTGFLNLSLNPKTDLDIDNTKDNEYAKFNKLTCPYIPKKCKDLDASMVDFDCSTAHIAGDITQNILAKSVGADFEAKMNDRSISDKELRDMLRKTNKLSSDQISALLILRNQSIEAKYTRAKEELKRALKLKPEEDIDQYIANHGGEDKVLDDSKVSSAIRRKINDKYLGYVRDNIYSESIDDNQSSYFSNYFALGNKTDEKVIAAKSQTSLSSANQAGGPSSSGTVGDQSTTSTSGSTARATNNDSGSPAETQEPAPIYKRRSFDEPASPRLISQQIINPPVDHNIVADKPVEKAPEVAKPAVAAKKEETREAVAATEVAKVNDVKPGPVVASGSGKSVVSDSSFFLTSSSSSTSSNSDSGKPKVKDDDNLSTKQLEDRLAYVQQLAAEAEARKRGNNSGGAITNPEIENLRDQIAREKNKLANQNRMNAINAARNRGGSGSDSGGNNSAQPFGNNSSNNGSSIGNGNTANAYDPLDRATTGRRDLNDKDPKAVAAAAAAAGAEKNKSDEGSSSTDSGGGSGKSGKKVLTAGSSGGVADSSAVGGSGRASKGARYPAQDNGESDPDDICGYDQKVACYFEFASIDVLSPSLAKFVEYIQLQGRSFMALEVYKYKNKNIPTKYFIHEYEPSANMSEEDKNQMYLRVKKLALDYKKNRTELKKLASMVVEVRKREITREEVKELSKSILRLPDLNKLSARRARNQ